MGLFLPFKPEESPISQQPVLDLFHFEVPDGKWRTIMVTRARHPAPATTGAEPPADATPASTAIAGGRLHLDLYADDPDGEAARLLRLGARSVRRIDAGDTG
jgi:hypothetical protein